MRPSTGPHPGVAVEAQDPAPCLTMNKVFQTLAGSLRWTRPVAAFSGHALLSAWISRNPHRQIRGVYVQPAVVPCGPCRVCCQQGNVLLDTRIDHVSDYDAEQGVDPAGKTVWRLKHHPDGSCGYLDPVTRDCTIYERRPSLCKTFDCRRYAVYTDTQLTRVFMVPRHGFLIRDAAKEAINREHHPEDGRGPDQPVLRAHQTAAGHARGAHEPALAVQGLP